MSGEAFRSRIGSALSNRDFGEVEAAWREYVSVQPEDYAYLIGVSAQLSKYDKGGLAGELCVTLSTALLEKDNVEAAIEVTHAALKASQRTEGLREMVRAVYQKAHGSNSNLDTFMEKSGLASDTGGLRHQVDALERYLSFSEGSYVFHPGGWGYGEVVDFDPDDEIMTVDFQRKKGHNIKLLNAPKILRRLQPNHIGVYKHYRRDELLEIIKENPAQVFHLYLNSYGGSSKLKNVREELVSDNPADAVMSKTDWSKWWTKAKKALLTDPQIKIGKGSTPLIELREEALTIEQEVAEKMLEEVNGIRQVAVGREYLRTLGVSDTLVATIRPVAQETLLRYEEAHPERVALLYFIADLKGEEGARALAEATELIDTTEDLAELIGDLDAADRKRAVSHVAKVKNDGWQEDLVSLLQTGDSDVADAVQESLVQSRPDLLIKFFADLSSNPGSNPNLFLWYTKGIMTGSIPEQLVPGEKKSAVLEKLLTLTNTIGLQQKRVPDPDLKEWLRLLRAFFTSRRLKTFRGFVEGTDRSYGKYLFAKIQRNHGFTEQTKSALLDVIEAEHSDLHTSQRKGPVTAVPAGDVIYTTLRGYHTKELELKNLVEVEVPANAEDLGRAASFGDISENAEYSAALEKQERIMTRVRELRESLDKARILDAGEVTTERVVVGTRVKLRNLTKKTEESYSLLGPWDADVENGIISYLSPVGLGLLGKEAGANAEIDLPEGRVEYQVLTIDLADPALLQPEVDES